MYDTPTVKRRCYRLTPDRMILALLPLEGFLLLSERFRWFAFNQWKGWTVLIAVASVGLALALMLLWFAASLVLRWRFQFSIRSLLVLVVVVAVPCSWLAVERAEARTQKEAVEALGIMQVLARYDNESEAGDPFGARQNRPIPHGWGGYLGMTFSWTLLVCMCFLTRGSQMPGWNTSKH